MNISEYIRFRREEKGISLNQLALYTGVSNAHISRIENGKRKPSPDILRKLSKHLGVTYDELMQVCGYLDDSNSDILQNIERLEDIDEIENSSMKKDNIVSIGKRLKSRIEQLGIKQNELAKKLNISVSTLNGYFTDYREPDTEMIKTLAGYLETTTSYIIGETDDPTPFNTKKEPTPEIGSLEWFRAGLLATGRIKETDTFTQAQLDFVLNSFDELKKLLGNESKE